MGEIPLLYSECIKCGGSGIWTEPPYRGGSSMTYYSLGECPDCEGVGAIPTKEMAHAYWI